MVAAWHILVMRTFILGLACASVIGCVASVSSSPADEGATGGSATGGSATGGDAEGGSSDGGEGGAVNDNPSCAALLDIQIVDVSVNAGPDNIWSVGEGASIVATLLSPDDNFDYPSIIVTHAGVEASPLSSGNSLFGIIANEATPLGAFFMGDAAGTVTFEVEVAHVSGPCVGAARTTFSAQIQ